MIPAPASAENYQLLDYGDGRKLERMGIWILDRPSPASDAIQPRRPHLWAKANFYFRLSERQQGNWYVNTVGLPVEVAESLGVQAGPETSLDAAEPKWTEINSGNDFTWKCRLDMATFLLKLTPFGNVGWFAEHFQHWRRLAQKVRRCLSDDSFAHEPSLHEPSSDEQTEVSADVFQNREAADLPLGDEDVGQALLLDSPSSPDVTNEKLKLEVLSLFAYTGGSSISLAGVGATVTHVEGAKNTIQWARQNAQASYDQPLPIRWICDDVMTYVQREVKRGRKYQGLIIDPPAYGHGPKKQVWKIHTDLPVLVQQLSHLCDESLQFVLLTAHSADYTPNGLAYLLGECIKRLSPGVIALGKIESGPVELSSSSFDGVERKAGDRGLAAGVKAIWIRGES